MSRTGDTGNEVSAKDIKGLHARIKELSDRMVQELDKKKDKDVVDVELTALRQPHACTQEAKLATMSQSIESIEDGIKSIDDSLSRWRTAKLGGIVALVIAIVSGATYTVRSQAKTDIMETTVRKIETDVVKMRSSHDRIKNQLEETAEEAEGQSKKDMEAIRSMLKEELRSVQLLKPKNRRGK